MIHPLLFMRVLQCLAELVALLLFYMNFLLSTSKSEEGIFTEIINIKLYNKKELDAAEIK